MAREGKRLTTTLSREFDIPANMALDFAARALSTVGVTSVEEDPTHEVVSGKTGTTWRTWGQQLKVNVESTVPGKSLVTVSSAPKFRNPRFDFGASKAMVNDVIDNLAEAARVHGLSG